MNTLLYSQMNESGAPPSWWPRWLVVLVVLGLVIGGSAFIISRQSRAEYDRAVADAKRVGLPLSLRDVIGPEIPAEQNRLEVYSEAESLLKGSYKGWNEYLMDLEDAKPSASASEKIDRALSVLQPALRLLLGTPRPKFQFVPPNLSSDASGELDAQFRYLIQKPTAFIDLTRLLSLEAEASIRKGRLAEANVAIDRNCQLGDDCVKAPLIAGMFIATLVGEYANNDIQRELRSTALDAQSLTELKRLVESRDDVGDPHVSFAGEVILVLRGAPNLGSGSVLSGVQQAAKPKFVEAWAAAWPQFPRRWDDGPAVLAAIAKLRQGYDSAGPIIKLLSSSHLPKLEKYAKQFGIAAAERRMLVCAIALFQARNASGHFPGSLPLSLGNWALNPFTDKPIVYALSGNRFKMGCPMTDADSVYPFDEKHSVVIDFSKPLP